MSFGGPNPAISAEAARKALSPNQVSAANRHDTSDEQAALDEAELQELEHAEYYGDTKQATEPVPAPVAPHRSLLDRLFHRS